MKKTLRSVPENCRIGEWLVILFFPPRAGGSAVLDDSAKIREKIA
jgi:hypothetical protein